MSGKEQDVLDHDHDWNFGSGWALYIDKTLPAGEQTGWRRECSRCGAWQWCRRLDWEIDRARDRGHA